MESIDLCNRNIKQCKNPSHHSPRQSVDNKSNSQRLRSWLTTSITKVTTSIKHAFGNAVSVMGCTLKKVFVQLKSKFRHEVDISAESTGVNTAAMQRAKKHKKRNRKKKRKKCPVKIHRAFGDVGKKFEVRKSTANLAKESAMLASARDSGHGKRVHFSNLGHSNANKARSTKRRKKQRQRTKRSVKRRDGMGHIVGIDMMSYSNKEMTLYMSCTKVKQVSLNHEKEITLTKKMMCRSTLYKKLQAKTNRLMTRVTPDTVEMLRDKVWMERLSEYTFLDNEKDGSITTFRCRNVYLLKGASCCVAGDGPGSHAKKHKTSKAHVGSKDDVDLSRRVDLIGPGLAKGYHTFTGLNHCGGVSAKDRGKSELVSKLDPICAEMTRGNIDCHFGVENRLNCNVKRSVESTLRSRIDSTSKGTVSITINCPIQEAISASSAVSASNDTLILFNNKMAMPQRQTSEPYKGANGRITMQFVNIDKQITALICVYGLTDTCGALTMDEKKVLSKANATKEAKSRTTQRRAARRHLDNDLRKYVNLAKECGATIVLFTDANATNHPDDRTSGAVSNSSILDSLDDLGLLDVWPRVKQSTSDGNGHTFHRKHDDGSLQSSRIDRFYICQNIVEMCGGFENIKIDIGRSTGGLSDAHKLLVLNLPPLVHSENAMKFSVNRGESNRKFIFDDTESTEWATAMENDVVLKALRKHLDEASCIRNRRGVHLGVFKDAAHALTSLGITDRQAKLLRKGDIEHAFTKQLKEPENNRALLTEMLQAKTLLNKIVTGKGGTWKVQPDTEKWTNAGNSVVIALRKRGRLHENTILDRRPKKKFWAFKGEEAGSEEKLLSRISKVWDAVKQNKDDDRKLDIAVRTTMLQYETLRFKCRLPEPNRTSIETFDWTTWSTDDDCNGLSSLAARIVGLQCQRSVFRKRQLQDKRCTAAVAGKTFSAQRGNTMSGLNVINDEGEHEWITSDADLRDSIGANVQNTSRGRNVGEKGQSVVVSTWLEVLSNTQRMWNGVTMHNMVDTLAEARIRWQVKQQTLQILEAELAAWCNTEDDIVVVGGEMTSRENHKQHKDTGERLKTMCMDTGYAKEGCQKLSKWLRANLAESKLLRVYVDNNLEFLYKSMTSVSQNAPKATVIWRELEHGPQNIEDIVSTAMKMKKSKTHAGLSPEHVCVSQYVQQTLLKLSEFYFAGCPPDAMKTGIVTSIYKDSERFRPITNLDVSFQLCEAFYMNKEMEIAIMCGSSRQFGGLVGRSGCEPLLELELLVEDALANNKMLVAWYADKSSAFDSTSPSMFGICYKRWGCPKHISMRMASVASGHRRICKTSMGTDDISTAFTLESGVPRCH